MNKSIIKNEVVRSGRDPNYFIRRYVKIQHPVRGLISFDPFDYQSELLESYRNHRRNVVLKARQLGVTELTAAYAAWLMLFHKDKNVLIIATKRETAKGLIRKIRTTIANLPPWLMLCEITADNVHSIELSNGSRVKAVSTSPDAGRSEALSLLIVDEAAHIPQLEEIWAGLKPTVSAGGDVIVMSTPNGVGNLFHQLCDQGRTGENDFHYTKLMWWLHPERQKNLRDDPYRPGFKLSDWFEEETKGMSQREIAQELECNFNSSGDNVFAQEVLDLIENNDVRPPISCEYHDRNYHIFNAAIQFARYFVVADVARGDASDYSSAHVFNVDTMEQEAEYNGQLPVEDFAELLVRIGGDYNTAPLFVENNATGILCLEHIKLRRYDAVYYSRKHDLKHGEIVNTNAWVPDFKEFVPGFTTTQKSRPLITTKLDEYIRRRNITIRSRRFLEQLRHWIWHNGRAQAQHGYNDDLVMAAAIGCWIHETFYASSVWNEAGSKAFLGATTYKQTSNVQIPGGTKDPRFVKQNERMSANSLHVARQRSLMSLPDGRGGIVDIGWLLDRK